MEDFDDIKMHGTTIKKMEARVISEICVEHSQSSFRIAGYLDSYCV
jgi:hypothetical protein